MSDVIVLLIVAGIALMAAGALAPLEALGWWAGWFEGRDLERDAGLEPADGTDSGRYLVFLTGIHSVDGETFARREKILLDRLREELPDTRVLEVFPYSVTNRPLTGERFFAWFWRWALSMKLSGRALAGAAGMVINLRNVWQMSVSADRRYGPIYNRGSAMLIADALRRAGGRRGANVVLVGYSGGGQVALGAASHLKGMTGGEVTVVSLGGVMCSDAAIHQLDRVYDLHGDGDRIQQIGNLFFPGRWPVFTHSSWNQARRAGIVHNVPMGPPDHMGDAGYLDDRMRLPDGRSYLDQTVDVLAAIVRREDPLRMAAGQRPPKRLPGDAGAA